MNTITVGRIGYNCGPREGRQVDPELVHELQERGFHRPVRTLADPRLRLPELLLMEGWDRSATDECVTYSRTVESDPSSGQEVVFGADSRREVHTRVDGRVHILRATPDGKVEESRG